MDYDFATGLVKAVGQGVKAYGDTKAKRQEIEKKAAEDAAEAERRKMTEKLRYKAQGFDVVEDEFGDIVDIKPIQKQMSPEEQEAKKTKGLIDQLTLEKAKLDIEKAKKEQKTPGTEGQIKAAGFARRIEQAEDVFSELEKGGYDRSTLGETLKSKASGFLPSSVKGELSRQEQAERNFVTAVLRRESGAAISPKEFSDAEQQYFPRYGDSPDVLKQKALNRMQVLENLRAEAGPTVESVKRVGGLIQAGPQINSELTPARAEAQQMSGEDAAAFQWANSNPQDPRAAEIKRRLGVK